MSEVNLDNTYIVIEGKKFKARLGKVRYRVGSKTYYTIVLEEVTE